MTRDQLIESVNRCTELEWLETPAAEAERIYVRHVPTGGKFEIAIEEALKNKSFEAMLGVFRGEREARPLTHVSRIVGYYSQIENWNPSKLSELEDRHRGDYSLTKKE